MPENLKAVEKYASSWNRTIQYCIFAYLMWKIVSLDVTRMKFIEGFLNQMLKGRLLSKEHLCGFMIAHPCMQ